MHRDGLETGRRVECSQCSQCGNVAKCGNADWGAHRVHAGMWHIQRTQEGREVQRVLESDWQLQNCLFRAQGESRRINVSATSHPHSHLHCAHPITFLICLYSFHAPNTSFNSSLLNFQLPVLVPNYSNHQ